MLKFISAVWCNEIRDNWIVTGTGTHRPRSAMCREVTAPAVAAQCKR